MRTMSQAAAAVLAQTQGLEPLLIVQVFWTDESPIFYCDRQIPQLGITGRILEISNIEAVVNISKSSNTSAITIKLDDTTGVIKSIFDYNDIIKQQVYVFQWFTNLSIDDAFIVFEGEISSPIDWKEGERTITFDVLSKIEDQQYGFSADEGNFEYIPAGIVGQAWPLTFGYCDWVKSLKLYDLPVGLLKNSTKARLQNNGNRRRSLLDAYYKAFNNWNECLTKQSYCSMQSETLQSDLWQSGYVSQIPMNGNLTGKTVFPPGTPQPPLPATPQNVIWQMVAGFTTDQWSIKAANYAVQAFNYGQQCQQIENELYNLGASQETTIQVQNGSEFPQGVQTSITIGSDTYSGQFSGDIFTVISSSSPFSTDGNLLAGPLTINDSQAATQYAATLNEQNFFYNIAGQAVINSGQMSYIVSMFECSVPAVYAVYNGLMTCVPSSLYSVNYVDFGTFQATYITFPMDLKLIDPKWSETIYCSVQSPVGPNAVDVLVWLIQQYTNFSYDPVSFGIVRDYVAPFSVGFTLDKQGNIVKLLSEIAFQMRCAIWFSEGLFYLKFLPDMTTYVDTIDETDVEFGTMQVSCTPTEELVTKYTASFSAGLAYGYPQVNPITYELLKPAGQDLVIWYYNVQKYGLIEKKDSYFIYSDPNLVALCSMFWLVRYTNTWKRVKFSTFLTHLDLETFDFVLLNFSHPWVSDGPVIGMVESCLYDSAQERVELTVWLPIIFGQMVPYDLAAPYNLSPTYAFPESFTEASGTPTGKGTSRAPLVPANSSNASGYMNPMVPFGNIPNLDQNYQAPTPVSELGLGQNLSTLPNTTVPQSSNQYKIKPVTDYPNSDLPGTCMGIVQSQVGSSNQYNVNLYPNGYKNGQGTPINIVVTQIQIDPTAVIPSGTVAYVIRTIVPADPASNSTGSLGIPTYTVEYTMQVPVWLQAMNPPVGPGGGNGNTNPQSTPGTPGPPTNTTPDSGEDGNDGEGGDDDSD